MEMTQKHNKMTQSIENQLVTKLTSILTIGKKNGKIESFEINDATNSWMGENFQEFEIGFAYNNMAVWHWFKLTIMDGNEYLSFRESYSRNTGKSKKGWTHGFNVRQSINKKLGTNIF